MEFDDVFMGFILMAIFLSGASVCIAAYCLLELKAQKYSTHTIELRDMNTVYDDELDEVIKEHELNESPDLQYYDKDDDISIDKMNKEISKGMVI